MIVLLDLFKVSKITNFHFDLFKVSKMTNFNYGLFKVSKMTNFNYHKNHLRRIHFLLRICIYSHDGFYLVLIHMYLFL